MSEVDQLKLDNKRKDAELEILKEYKELDQLDIPEGCVLHSDQGSVYTSYSYYKLCEEKGIIRNMSRKERQLTMPQ